VTEQELTEAAAAIQALVEASPDPVAGATAAHAGRRAVPQIAAAGWGHNGDGLAGLVRDRLPMLEFRRNTSGEWLLGPHKHALSPEPLDKPDDVVATVCRVTHAPHLTSSHYAALFRHLAKAAAGEHQTLNRLGPTCGSAVPLLASP
jgi:hypothetical protein